jgi:hypothetical protein
MKNKTSKNKIKKKKCRTGTKNLTPSEIDKILYLYANNIRICDICEYFDRNPATIHRLVVQLGVTRKFLEDVVADYEELKGF